MSTHAVAPAVAAPTAVVTPVQTSMLQRSCDCGQHTGGGECEGCKKKNKTPLQRYANGSGLLPLPSPVAPPIVHEVLDSSGESLDPEPRSFMESRFRQDFSQVRVHTDPRAAESAHTVGAQAYTVGRHVVFDAGRFAPATKRGRQLLAHELSHVVQQRNVGSCAVQQSLEIGSSDDPFEIEADETARRVTEEMEPGEADRSLSDAPARLQRATAAAPGLASAAPATPSPQAAMFLVEDDTKEIQAGQMRKGEFLDKLQAAVCGAADEELAAVGRTAKGCPYIERWIGHLRSKSSQFVERAIRKYAPGNAGVIKAEEYIPLVTARVRRGVARWAKTGEITEVPDELKGQLQVANVANAMDRLFSGVGGVLGAVGSAVTTGVRAIGGLLAKERQGGVRDADAPQVIQTQLGSGHPLDGGIKSRMETALGADFSHVRIHTDSTASSLSTRVNARAFTIGSDVAFGAGEYQPGTLIGDALIAHELAHVVQQQRDASSLTAMSNATNEYTALEADADSSAMEVLMSLWNHSKVGLSEIGKRSIPRLRSGLRLQRCGAKPAQTPVVPGGIQPAPPTAGTTAEGTEVAHRGADASAASQINCGGSSKASTYTPTTEGLTPQSDLGALFGVTSKSPATTTFDACKVGQSWRFYLKDLVVRIASAVQPENFRINVNSAADPVVTRDNYREIIRDLSPTAEGDDTHHCGGAAFPEHVTHYSRRRRFWKHQFTVDHEAFHRNDWNNMYRPELNRAESEVWKFVLPEASASTAPAAVIQAIQTLRGFFTDAYNRTCQNYAPEQETRAYSAGAAGYQNIVDAVRNRATSEGWDRATQQSQQPQQQQTAPLQHQVPGQQQQQPPPPH
jgi:Domain of unknown function (DUF4157)